MKTFLLSQIVLGLGLVSGFAYAETTPVEDDGVVLEIERNLEEGDHGEENEGDHDHDHGEGDGHDDDHDHGSDDDHGDDDHGDDDHGDDDHDHGDDDHDHGDDDHGDDDHDHGDDDHGDDDDHDHGDDDHGDDDHDHGDDDHDHDHDHGDFDLEQFSVVFEGQDLEGKECFLGVLPEDDTTAENLLLVQTSFEHEGEGAGTLSITLAEDQTRFTGTSESGMIAIQLAEGSIDLHDATSFAVSWEHEGHTDRGFCQNLEVIKDLDGETGH